MLKFVFKNVLFYGAAKAGVFRKHLLMCQLSDTETLEHLFFFYCL